MKRHRLTAASIVFALLLGPIVAACGGSGSAVPASATVAPSGMAAANTTASAGTTPGPITASSTVPSQAGTPGSDESKAAPPPSSTSLPTNTPVPTASAPSPAAAPAGIAFYTPPNPLPAGNPGDIIWMAPAPAPAGAQAWKVLYHSRAVDGTDIAVSGYVVAPTAPAPAGGFPILAWAHGTTGIADQCAPTRTGSPSDDVPYLADFIAHGYVVAATDYEGLGTPGVHPYVVGESEAHSLLDNVRAARNIATAHAGTRVLAFGQSQGGHAVLETAEYAAAYAPELQLLGVVAGGPLTELSSIVPVLEKTPYFGYLFMAGAGFDAAYHTHILDDLLTPAAQAGIGILQTTCVDGILAHYAGVAPESLLIEDPLKDPDVQRLATLNTPGNVKTGVPILVLHGGADAQIPPILSTLYTQRACKIGDTVELKFYPGLGHTGPIEAGETTIMQWLSDRLAGLPAPSSCANIPNPP